MFIDFIQTPDEPTLSKVIAIFENHESSDVHRMAGRVIGSYYLETKSESIRRYLLNVLDRASEDPNVKNDVRNVFRHS